jgi:hypothetical protein
MFVNHQSQILTYVEKNRDIFLCPYIIKPLYKGFLRESENVPFMSSCPYDKGGRVRTEFKAFQVKFHCPKHFCCVHLGSIGVKFKMCQSMALYIQSLA